MAGAPPFTEIGVPIRTAIDTHKQRLEKLLVMKVEEIARRETPYVRRVLRLHRADPSGGHPKALGDYDTFVYLPTHNTVVCVECKDLREAFNARDALTLHQKLYKSPGHGKPSEHERVLRREAYIKDNSIRVLAALGWPSPTGTLIVRSVWVSRVLHWSLVLPPVPTTTPLLVPEELQQYFRDPGSYPSTA